MERERVTKLDQVFVAKPAPEVGIVPMTLPCDYTTLDPVMRRAVREEYVRLQRGQCPYLW